MGLILIKPSIQLQMPNDSCNATSGPWPTYKERVSLLGWKAMAREKIHWKQKHIECIFVFTGWSPTITRILWWLHEQQHVYLYPSCPAPVGGTWGDTGSCWGQLMDVFIGAKVILANQTIIFSVIGERISLGQFSGRGGGDMTLQ